MFQPMDVNLGAQQLPSMPVPQMPDLPGMAKRTGMFGAGGVGRNIAGMIGDFLLQRAGMQPIYTPAMLQQRKMQLEQQQYQRERADKRDDFTFEQDYKAAHPAPVNNDTVADYQFWKSVLPPEQFQQYVANKVNPPQLMEVPGVGIVSVPRMQSPQVPTAPVGNLRPYNPGGPSPSGSGGFPY